MNESLFSLLMKGGVVIIPIAILSVITVYLFALKFFFIRDQAKIDESFIRQMEFELGQHNVDRARVLAANNNTAIGRIVKNAVNKMDKPVDAVEKVMESSTNIEIALMEKNIGYLGVIASVAPMLGFIGTIAGVIHIFYNISLSDNVSIGIIAGGLYQKMVSSGTGLLVGVMAYSAYHILQAEIDKFSLNVQRSAFSLLESLR